MIKSPLRYPGGKSRAAELISTLIPPYQEFREPFLGGGSVFLYMKQKYPNHKYWVNDLYLELYKFWEMCQKDVTGVISQVVRWKTEYPEGRELHQFLKKNIETFDCTEKAAAFFIFNRITFSGTTLSGGYSEGAFTGRFTESCIERVTYFAELINGVSITNLDYEEVVTKDGENVFIFLDPPYYSATKSALYGKNGNMHKSFDHERFALIMQNCPHKWLITYDDCPYIRELFSFANIFSWDLTYGMRNVRKDSDTKGKELFISNYLKQLPIDGQMKLF